MAVDQSLLGMLETMPVDSLQGMGIAPSQAPRRAPPALPQRDSIFGPSAAPSVPDGSLMGFLSDGQSQDEMLKRVNILKDGLLGPLPGIDGNPMPDDGFGFGDINPSLLGEAIFGATPANLPPPEATGLLDVTGDTVMDVFGSLRGSEGTGSNITGDVDTGDLGVTAAARAAVGGKGLSDKRIAMKYLKKLNNTFTEKFDGYRNAPDGVRNMILDGAYNLGAGVKNFKGLKQAMKDAKESGDWASVGKHMLDTANAGGKSMRGLAKRRALAYNRIEGVKPIASVESGKDGKITYLDAEGGEVFAYTPRGGRHTDSGVGTINVDGSRHMETFEGPFEGTLL